MVEPAADRFGRERFVDRAADLLERVRRSAESTVVGLTGPWGSGKTSALNLVLGRLDPKLWSIVQANPWATSGEYGVVAGLLRAVELAAGARARSAVKRYGAAFLPALDVVPMAGVPVRQTAQAMIAAAARTEDERRTRLERKLRRAKRTILVVIDDVDRLHADELLSLFKAVRLIGRLPNVQYLLAYDETTVLGLLRGTDVASGDSDRARE